MDDEQVDEVVDEVVDEQVDEVVDEEGAQDEAGGSPLLTVEQLVAADTYNARSRFRQVVASLELPDAGSANHIALYQEMFNEQLALDELPFDAATRDAVIDRFGEIDVDGKLGPQTYAVYLTMTHASTPEVAPTLDDAMAIKHAVSRFEGPHDAINADGEYRGKFGSGGRWYQKEHVGLSWGCIQFTQESGALGKVLSRCRRYDPAAFERIFGEQWAELLRVTNLPDSKAVERTGMGPGKRNDRVVRIGGVDIWEGHWRRRFVEAGRHPAFQRAQDHEALVSYLLPAARVAKELGVRSLRGLAIMLDRTVHMGVAGGPRLIRKTFIPGAEHISLYLAYKQWGNLNEHWWGSRTTRLYEDVSLSGAPMDVGLLIERLKELG